MRPFKKMLAKRYIAQQAKDLPVILSSPLQHLYEIIPVTELKYPTMYLLKEHLQKSPNQIHLEQGDLAKRLAVIVPFRNRQAHLAQFIPSITRYLLHQQIRYDIFVIHQADQQLFNKGMLCNIGFALTQANYDYFCFHDVDTLPEKTTYRYINHPCCLRVSEPLAYFGGALLFTQSDFQTINGFSNRFWNWGFEDENLRDRCYLAGLVPIRLKEGIYQELMHQHSTTQTPDGKYHTDNKILKTLLNAKRKNRQLANDYKSGKLDYRQDGLNTLRYEMIRQTSHDGYTLIDVIL